MKLVTVVGARPQFVKAAVLARAIAAHQRAHPGSIHDVLVHTGQHHDAGMSDVFFEELGLAPPAHHLGVAGGTHGEMTGRMLERLDPVLTAEAPDRVLVYGDTNSTLAGALSAAKLGFPVAHVEAGLRSFDRAMPEETNRVLTDHLADLLFAPTAMAVANLEREGITGARVVRCGDVMFDAALHHAVAGEPSAAVAEWIAAHRDGYFVATVHRAENTDDPARLAALLGALADVSARTPVVLPLHPRTRLAARGWSPPPGLRLLPPLGHRDTLHLLRGSTGVLTDSGGLQKEAYFFRRPCLVLRDRTEWVELVDGGHARLVGADPARIREGAREFLGRELAPGEPLYGDGRAGERIVAELLAR